MGRVASTWARVRDAWPSEKGNACCVASSDQVASMSLADIFFQPAMNLSIVAAWTEAGADIVMWLIRKDQDESFFGGTVRLWLRRSTAPAT